LTQVKDLKVGNTLGIGYDDMMQKCGMHPCLNTKEKRTYEKETSTNTKDPCCAWLCQMQLCPFNLHFNPGNQSLISGSYALSTPQSHFSSSISLIPTLTLHVLSPHYSSTLPHSSPILHNELKLNNKSNCVDFVYFAVKSVGNRKYDCNVKTNMNIIMFMKRTT
jgi:hypothetical protein